MGETTDAIRRAARNFLKAPIRTGSRAARRTRYQKAVREEMKYRGIETAALDVLSRAGGDPGTHSTLAMHGIELLCCDLEMPPSKFVDKVSELIDVYRKDGAEAAGKAVTSWAITTVLLCQAAGLMRPTT